MKLRYLIRCQSMTRTEEFIASDFHDLVRIMADYVGRYGPIDLLYYVDRA